MKKTIWIFCSIVGLFFLVIAGRKIPWDYFSTQVMSCAVRPPLQRIWQNKPFAILYISYGNLQQNKDSFRSIFEQDYRNFRLFCIDESGNQNAFMQLQDFVKKNFDQHKIFYLKGAEKGQELENIYNAITLCQDYEIVLLMRQGDQLAHNQVLSSLNQSYANPDTWLVYGKHLDIPSYLPSQEEPLKLSEIAKKKGRKRDFFDFGLKSFYAGLFKKIALQDFLCSGFFYIFVEDFAIMMPLIEMASSHISYLPEIHYLKYKTLSLKDQDPFYCHVQPYYLQILKKTPPYSPLHHTPFVEENKSLYLADLIVYSENPQNLSLFLESIQENVEGISKIFVIVSSWNQNLYDEVKKKYPDAIFFEQIPNHLETAFMKIFFHGSSKFLFCSTDQYVVKNKIHIKECAELLSQTKARGFYFGLGEDVSYCFRGGFEQSLPSHLFSLGEEIRGWQIQERDCGDWAFPDGFVMTLYESSFLVKVFDELQKVKTLRELEQKWSLLPQEKRIGLCFRKTHLQKISFPLK